jgi:hypothetical protein
MPPPDGARVSALCSVALLGRWTGILALVGACVLLCAGGAQAAGWWDPPQQLTWYWQLSGTPAVEPVQASDVDGFDTSASTVAAFHARGQHMICYVDVGTAENWRSDNASFPSSVLGDQNGWPGERWVDIRQLSVLEPIMTARFQMCQQKGFDAVEPDNMDGYGNTTGFPLQASDQLTYDKWIAAEVHSLGMAVLQKNDSDQASALQPFFDGVLDEQCSQYNSCSAYQPYVSAGKPVLNAEYDTSLSPGFCASDAASGMMGALYALALDGSLYTPCFGPSTTTPVTSPPSGSTGSGGRPPAQPGSGTRRRASLDRVAPRVRVFGGHLTLVHGAVGVTLACPGGQSYCAGRLTLRAPRRSSTGRRRAAVELGAMAFRVGGGKRRAFTVKLGRPAVRRLRSRAPVQATVTVAAHNRAGRHATIRRRLEIVLGTH